MCLDASKKVSSTQPIDALSCTRSQTLLMLALYIRCVFIAQDVIRKGQLVQIGQRGNPQIRCTASDGMHRREVSKKTLNRASAIAGVTSYHGKL